MASDRGNSIADEGRMIAPGVLAGVVAFLASLGAFIASVPFWLSSIPASGAILLALPSTVVLLALLSLRRSVSTPTHPF